MTFYDASGAVVASETLAPNGSYAITIGGLLAQSKTVNADDSYVLRNYASGVLTNAATTNADGSHDTHYYTSGTFNGAAYVSYDYAYDATNFRTLATYYDGSGAVVASETFASNGGYVITTPTGRTIAGGNTSSQLDGSAGNTVVRAGSVGDTLVGGPGDALYGGAGADTFAFHAGFGQETLYSFAATGTAHDSLQFDSNLFADWAHLLGATKQQGSDLLITLDVQDTLLLKSVALANFTSADARFV
jgi:hypothetical protein